MARIIEVHRDQADDLHLFQNQADRWRASPGPTEAQRPGIAAYDALIAQLRQINAEVLAVAAELASGTIETVLAKSDLELGIEVLMRGCARRACAAAGSLAGLLEDAAPTAARSALIAPAAVADRDVSRETNGPAGPSLFLPTWADDRTGGAPTGRGRPGR